MNLWIDDCMIWVYKRQVVDGKDEFIKNIDCKAIGPLTDYVGCKIEQNYSDRSIRFTQPFMIKGLQKNFQKQRNKGNASHPKILALRLKKVEV